MSVERAHDDSRIEFDTSEPYYPAMPSETLLEWGPRLIRALNRYE